MYHLGCKLGEVHKDVLLFGDPARCELAKKVFDEYAFLSSKRGFVLYNGRAGKFNVTFGALGIGGPSWCIGLHELVLCGAELFVRVGTAGIISPDVMPGDIVIPSEVVSDESLSKYVLGVDKELKPDNSLFDCLVATARGSNRKHHSGKVHSKDFLYMEEPDQYPLKEQLMRRMESLRSAGILVTEMECASLFAFGSARGYSTGAVLATINSDENLSLQTQIAAIKIALNSVIKYRSDQR